MSLMARNFIQNIPQRVAWEAQGLSFLLRNARYSQGLPKMSSFESEGLVFSGLPKTHLAEVDRVHNVLRGLPLSWNRRYYLYAFGEKMCGIVRRKAVPCSIVAFQLLYFRRPESGCGVIHEAYIGVMPEFRGMGIATNLRRFTTGHLRKAGVKKVSSQVDQENVPSLRSALKVGFEISGQAEGPQELRGGNLHLLLDLQQPQFPMRGNPDVEE